MYPVIRMFYQLAVTRTAPALPLTGTHVSRHRCWPWDIDLWMELNNGRTLTFYDLGRIPLARRTGLVDVLKRKRWGLTMAGASVRYRARIRTFEVVEMRSRAVGWDDKFIYLEQSMWKGETCCNQIVYRSAVISRDGIVPPAKLLQEMGLSLDAPDMPRWIQAWIEAEAERPWPPEG
ncbi:acyl-CoA thioesterase [Nioella nitratireducens]|uniref:acyl-CoA thioesterase n=1 Tax=Nioella nitratireducens TaxID=1287720 RepID=UPI0008FD943D|nr:acyl-CoA thioesterase [Nioella nitratireducens]